MSPCHDVTPASRADTPNAAPKLPPERHRDDSTTPLTPKDLKRHIHQSKDYADDYDDKIARIIPNYFQLLDEAVAAVPFATNEPINVLELGFGTGNLTSRLLLSHPRATVYGLDYSPYMTPLARAKLRRSGLSHSRFKPVCEDITSFRYDSLHVRFDLVIGTLIFHDLAPSERDGLFQALRPLLTDHAAVIIGDVVGSPSKVRDHKFYKAWIRRLQQAGMSDPDISALFAHPEMREMLTAATIETHERTLERSGVASVLDVQWKRDSFAVLIAQRT